MPEEKVIVPQDPSERFLGAHARWKQQVEQEKQRSNAASEEMMEVRCADLGSVAFSPPSFDLKK